MKRKLVQLLHEGNYSCVIENGEIQTFSQRGIVDLYNILNGNKDFLKGAYVADKVIGKAAAAILIAGGVKEIYADLISRQALDLLVDKDIKVKYGKEVPVIINRSQTDMCPMEKLCYNESSVDIILNLIKDFLNKSNLKTLALVLLGMTFSFGAKGQVKNDSIKKGLQLEEVIVTGTRNKTDIRNLSKSISVVTSEQINERQEQSLLPILNEQIPGLFITSRGVMGYGLATGAAGTMNLRGIGGSPTTGVLILIDGEPQYMGLMGHPIADSYQAMLADRVEVIRGPASVLYGSNAMGGVINIVTPKLSGDSIINNVRLSYGSYNTLESGISNSIRNGRFNSKIAASYNRSDGQRANMDFNQWSGLAKVGYDISKEWNAYVDLNLSHFNASNPGSIQQPVLDNDSHIFRGMTTLSIENDYSFTSGALRLYYNWGRNKINDGYSPGGQPRNYLYSSRDNMSGISWYQSATLFPNNRVTVGVDYQHFGGKAWNNYFNDSNSSVLADTTQHEVAGYLDFRQMISTVLTLDAGIRYDYHSQTGSHWIPEGGISWHLPRAIEIKANVSKGFRNPTIRELYMFPPHNPNLKPESIVNYELSFSQHLLCNRLYYGVNLFYLDGDNMIQTVMSNGRPLNINTGKVKNHGIEAILTYKINQVWSVDANYSWLDMKYPVIAAPEHKAFVEANYSMKRFKISTDIQCIDGLYTAVNPDKKENYLLWNLRANYRLERSVNIFANGENLLAKRYEINAGYPMPRATVNGGISINF